MARFLYPDRDIPARRVQGTFLALGWILGLVFGFFLFLHADDSVSSQMRRAVFTPVSIAGLVNVIYLPFLFSAFAVFISRPQLFSVIAFWKGASFSFVSFCACASFGSAGWLLWPLFQFSDISAVILVWIYWIRTITGANLASIRGIIPYLIAGTLIGSLDYLIISPFWAHL